MKAIPLCLCVLAFLLTSARQPHTPTPNADRPNFIIVYADDLGYGDLGCFGNTEIRTPNLDAMAGNGLKLTELYSVSPVCSPSRAGLMTGRYPVRMGINSVFFPESWTGMAPEEITLAEALKDLGYATGVFGKWHLGHHHQFLPLQQGFDEYFGIPYSNDMEAVVYMENNAVVSHEVDQRYCTQTYTDKAIDFIERHQDESFFVYLPHSMPHVPLYASAEFEGKSKAGRYGDVIEELDANMGRLLDYLDQKGLAENTIVVFSSDNGPWLAYGPDGGSAGPLYAGKFFTFEGGMRVPGIVQWKGHITPGQESRQMVRMIDWFPTFLELAGGAVPSDRPIDGADVSPLLLEGAALGPRELGYFNGRSLNSYRYGDWKFKKPYRGSGYKNWKAAVPAHDTLLFNLKDDPGEQHNLFATHKQELKEMLARRAAFLERLGELPPTLVTKQKADHSHKERQKQWLEGLKE